MFMKQNGCCAICGIHHTLLTKKLYVDHNHDTGELRGLLCNKCNLGLGIFGDDVSLLQKATDYLNKFVCEKETTFQDQLLDSSRRGLYLQSVKSYKTPKECAVKMSKYLSLSGPPMSRHSSRNEAKYSLWPR